MFILFWDIFGLFPIRYIVLNFEVIDYFESDGMLMNEIYVDK